MSHQFMRTHRAPVGEVISVAQALEKTGDFSKSLNSTAVRAADWHQVC